MKPRNKCGFETAKIGQFERESSEISCLKTVKISWFHLGITAATIGFGKINQNQAPVYAIKKICRSG